MREQVVNGEQAESWFHSPEFVAVVQRKVAERRFYGPLRGNEVEQVADPEEFVPELERMRSGYFRSSKDSRVRRGDPRERLPECDDLDALAQTFEVPENRVAQAKALERRGLRKKAKRNLLCGRLGKRVDCTESAEHRFYRPYLCMTRYCERCGPAWFRKKFAALMDVLGPVVEQILEDCRRAGREPVIALLDFTVPNTGEMPGQEAVRKFHKDLHRFWRAAERRFGIKGLYGWCGCDEFGGGNTNLHRHCVYVGPRLPQSKKHKDLSALWSEVRSERSFVSIKRARSLVAGLAHALKYPAKFLSRSTPERLAELEETFHGTRRFSTGGRFYRIKRMREPGEDSLNCYCPKCGGVLVERGEVWVSVPVLEREGRCDVGEVRREIARAKVFSEARSP